MRLLSFALLFLSFNIYSQNNKPVLSQRGLALFHYEIPALEEGKTDKLSILQIDPKLFKFELLAYGRDNKELENSNDEQIQSLKLRRFLAGFEYTALINASMFKKDYITSIAYMRDGKYINNARHEKKFSALLCIFHYQGIIKILDKTRHQDWKKQIENADIVIENYRTLSQGNNVWTDSPKNKKHRYMFQLGMDKKGFVYFFAFEAGAKGRSIYAFNELIRLKTPFSIEDAVYLDGGGHGIMQATFPRNKIELGAKLKAFSPNFLILRPRGSL